MQDTRCPTPSISDLTVSLDKGSVTEPRARLGALVTPLPLPPTARGLQAHAGPHPAFYMGIGDSNSGPYDCIARTLTH